MKTIEFACISEEDAVKAKKRLKLQKKIWKKKIKKILKGR